MDRAGLGAAGAAGADQGRAAAPTPPRKRAPAASSPGDTSNKKKWFLGGALGGSIGGLFRRRRHKSDSSSSLEEEELATPPSSRKTNHHLNHSNHITINNNNNSSSSFLRKRRDATNNNNNSNSKRKTRTNARVSGAFDHVVVTPLSHHVVGSPPKVQVNGGSGGGGVVLTDHQFGGSFPKSLNLQQDRHREWVSPTSPTSPASPPARLRGQDSTGSLDNVGRRREFRDPREPRDVRVHLAKQRAAAEALRLLRTGESSSDEGGSLHSNSSSLVRSDDSLPSRRTRAARTERYLKRMSREEDGLGRWPKALSASSSPVTSPHSRPRNPAHQPGTFPPAVYGVIQQARDPRLDPANIAGLPASSPSSSSGRGSRLVNGRSVSYDCDMNSSDLPGSQQVPPPPPPPRRVAGPQEQGGRPMSYAFETGSSSGSSHIQYPLHYRVESPHHYHHHKPETPPHAYHHPLQSYHHHHHHQPHSQQEAVQYPQRYYHPRETPATAVLSRTVSSPSSQSSTTSPPPPQQQQQQQQQQYTYYAEQAPRSRKPIHISTAKPEAKPEAQPLAAPMSPPTRRSRSSRPSSPRPQANSAKYYPSNSYSPTRNASELPTSPPSRRTQRGRLRSADSVSSLSSDMSSPQLPRAAPRAVPRAGALVRPIVQVKYEETKREPVNGFRDESSSVDDEEIMRSVERERKSTNLDDALSELEAIYKSLRLGDEDLLDRAERRDLPQGPYPTRVYQRSSSLDGDCSPPDRPQRVGPRRAGVPDKVADDMAYRRLRQAERPASQQDTRSIVSQAGSYLLVSTALSPAHSPSRTSSLSPEPDVTLDDVVYRTVRQANSTLRVAEHQPPFGIPLGPVAPSANSDYLHATPQDRYRPTFKPRKTPDVVKDDLAFRSLRKDGQRDSAGLPPNPADAVQLHPPVNTPPPCKKRAVRSLSANIFSLIQREADGFGALGGRDSPVEDREKQDFEKAQSVSDLAAVLQVAEKVQARKAQLSRERDPDATPRASTCYAATSTETLTGSRPDLHSSDEASTLDSLLDEMAKEARETSERLGREIQELVSVTPPQPRETSERLGREIQELVAVTPPQPRETSERLGREIQEPVSVTPPQPRETSERLGREIQEPVSVTPPQPRKRRSLRTTPDKDERASRQSVKMSHEERNRQLKEEKNNLLKEHVLAQARCRSGQERAASPEPAPAPAPILELSESARSQMESLQQLTEILSPKASRRHAPAAPDASPRRTVSVSPGRSTSTEDDQLPVSARVQLWNQRHHLKVTSKPPPANKVFTSPARSTTASPRAVTGEEEGVDCPDGRMDKERTNTTSSDEVEEVAPWRRRRPPSLESPRPAPEPPPDTTPDTAVPNPQAAPTAPEAPAPQAAPIAPAPQTAPAAPTESSDSSDRDDDDKEVAALLSNQRPPAAPAAAPRAAPAAPAGEGPVGACSSTSPAPWYRDPDSVLVACSYGVACAVQLADTDFLTALGILLACLSLVAFLLIS